MGECLEPIPAATECHAMPSNAIPSNVSGMDWPCIALEWHAFLPNGMPLNGVAMGECLAPWGRLGWDSLVAAWNWSPLGQAGMGCPYGSQSMLPTSCRSHAALIHILTTQGLRPTHLHCLLPVPFILVPTLISITIAYQYPRPTCLHHVLPIPIILVLWVE